MAAKKKNPKPPAQATKAKKARNAKAVQTDTPPVETAAPEATVATPVIADETPEVSAPVTPTTLAAVPEPETALVEVAAAGTEAVPQDHAKQPVPEPAPATETTLRFWQVRRGPEIVGRTQAGTEEWALKQARKQFGEDVTVEPGVEAPAPAPKDRSKGKKKADKDPSKLSALDAAAKVLAEAGQPMTTQEMIKVMAEKGYWKSPGGQTPHATLYSAILREIAAKGTASRFTKTERGKFGLAQ
jgi:hypothetical protein